MNKKISIPFAGALIVVALITILFFIVGVITSHWYIALFVFLFVPAVFWFIDKDETN